MPITFNEWMRQVDQILSAAIGFDSTDLTDRCWRHMFDDGITPREATEDIIADPWSAV